MRASTSQGTAVNIGERTIAYDGVDGLREREPGHDPQVRA
jgi:hypothetical protein